VYAEMTWTGSIFSVVLRQDNPMGPILDPQPSVPFNGEPPVTLDSFYF